MSKIGQLVSDTLTTITANDLSGIINLREEAFIKKTALTSVTIPNSVTSIGERAFYYCTGLTNITILSSVTDIDNSTFSQCTNLSTANLPNTLTRIGEYAFAYCPNLAIVIPSSVTTIGDYAYYYSCLAIPNYELFIPKSVSSIGQSCFGAKMAISGTTDNHNITSVVFEEDSALQTIPTNCFLYQGALTTISLPSNLTTIGISAFSDTGLSSITIPSSVTSIGNNAFKNTNSITEIRFLTPAGATISLPTAGSSTGMFYRKTAKSGVIVYTDNETIKNYGWSSDNLTCTFKHLDGTDWT